MGLILDVVKFVVLLIGVVGIVGAVGFWWVRRRRK